MNKLKAKTKQQKDEKPKREKPPPNPERVKINYDFRITESSKVDCGRPVDYSFKKYTKLHEVVPEAARTNRLGKIEKSYNNKYLGRSLWLNNNYLSGIENIYVMVDSIIEYPERLGFLDLSCNEITSIHSDILKLPNIAILYLHGNRINHLRDIYILRNLKKIHSLTIFGNPICDNTHLGIIRSVVVSLVPQLKKLDYNRLTKIEIERPINKVVGQFIESNGTKFPKDKETSVNVKTTPIKSTPGKAAPEAKQDKSAKICPPSCCCNVCCPTK